MRDREREDEHRHVHERELLQHEDDAGERGEPDHEAAEHRALHEGG